MDLKVSRKETRLQPDGAVEVLVSNIFDIYPVFDKNDPNLITDIDVIDGDREEQLDRAMWAAAMQKGQDPLDTGDGIQWAESLVGEVPTPVLMAQVANAVQAEGPGVRASFESVGLKNNMFIHIDLTNAV
jgi:hypothetical protein